MERINRQSGGGLRRRTIVLGDYRRKVKSHAKEKELSSFKVQNSDPRTKRKEAGGQEREKKTLTYERGRFS